MQRSNYFIITFILLCFSEVGLAQNKDRVWEVRIARENFGAPLNADVYDQIYGNMYFVQNRYDFIHQYEDDQKNFANPKIKHPIYEQIMILPTPIAEYNVKDLSVQTPNNGSAKLYLYYAYVQKYQDASGKKTEQSLAFFAPYNMREKGDKKVSYTKEVAQYLDQNPILISESHPDKQVETLLLSSTDQYKENATAITTYIYDVTTLHPNKKPFVIGKFMTYKNLFLGNNKFENSTLLTYDKNSQLTSQIDFLLKQGGKGMNLQRTVQFGEDGKIKDISINQYKIINSSPDPTRYIGKNIITNSLGYNFISKQVYNNGQLLIPEKLTKRWQLKDVNEKRDILADIQKEMNINPVEDKEQLIEFLTNFLKLNEIAYKEQNKYLKHTTNKHVYKGTYNKEGNPHGWGILFFTSEYNDQFYLGHFTNGKPDGFGIRHDFHFDNADIKNAVGYFVGNQLMYGIYDVDPKTTKRGYGNISTGKLNGNGFIVDLHPDFPDLEMGEFKDGKLNGQGRFYNNDRKLEGVFAVGDFVSGKSVYEHKIQEYIQPGRIIKMHGLKYVVMKNNNGNLLLDNGNTVEARAGSVTLTDEYSYKKQACNICHGKGYFTESHSNTYAGTTKTQKSYETGPTGYILWEKITKTTTPPTTITSSKTKKCSCYGGYLSNEPIPLKESQRF